MHANLNGLTVSEKLNRELNDKIVMNVARARGKERKRKIMIETNSDNQLNYCCESCWTTSHGMHYELQHSQQQQGRVNAVSFRKKQQHINRIREFRFNFRRMYSSSTGLITKIIVVIFVLTSTTKTCDSFPIDKVVSLTERTKPPFHYLFLKPSVLKYMLSSRCLPKSCISRNVASPGTKRSALFSSSQHRDNYVEDASNKDNDDSSDIPALNMHHQRHNHHHVTASRRHLPEMEKDELKALQVTDESHHSSSPSSSDILPNLGHRGHRQTSGSLHYSVQQDQQRFGSDRSQHNDNDNPKEHFLIQLKHDNERLQRLVNDLEDENRWLHHEISNKIVLEQFEGEGNTIMDATSPYSDNVTNNMWCDELEGGQCPIEPALSFGEALRDRAYWLVGLLILQSCSGIILARNEALLTNHPFSKCFVFNDNCNEMKRGNFCLAPMGVEIYRFEMNCTFSNKTNLIHEKRLVLFFSYLLFNNVNWCWW